MKIDKLREAFLEKRLNEWARWYVTNPNLIQGYGDSNLAKLRKWGLVLIQNNSHPGAGGENEDAEQMEKYIVDLTHFNELCGQALKDKYLAVAYGRYEGHQLTSDLARKHRISVRTFQDRVAKAKLYLHGRMDSKLVDLLQKKAKSSIAAQRECDILQA